MRRAGINGRGMWLFAHFRSARELWAGGFVAHTNGCDIRRNHRCPVWVYGGFSWRLVARGSRSARFRKAALLRGVRRGRGTGSYVSSGLDDSWVGPFRKSCIGAADFDRNRDYLWNRSYSRSAKVCARFALLSGVWTGEWNTLLDNPGKSLGRTGRSPRSPTATTTPPTSPTTSGDGSRRPLSPGCRRRRDLIPSFRTELNMISSKERGRKYAACAG